MKSATPKEQATLLKSEINQYYELLRSGRLQGRDWVEDELLYRNLRDSLAQINMQGIASQPDDKKYWRGVRSGPGWQIRPAPLMVNSFAGGAPGTNQPPSPNLEIKIAKGRKHQTFNQAVQQGKIFSKPVVFFLVGAVVSMGNEKTVRVEGAVDLQTTGISPDEVVKRKTGLWQQAIIERQGRHFIRAVMYLCQYGLARQTAYNQLLNTGWEGKKLLVACQPPKGNGRWSWLRIVLVIRPTNEELAGFSEVAQAVKLKTIRAIQQREEYFKGHRSILERLVQSGQNCNLYTNEVLALKEALPALEVSQICQEIRNTPSFCIPMGANAKSVWLTRNKYYSAKLTGLFDLNKEAALSGDGLKKVTAIAHKEAVPLDTNELNEVDATEIATMTSDDIEVGDNE